MRLFSKVPQTLPTIEFCILSMQEQNGSILDKLSKYCIFREDKHKPN